MTIGTVADRRAATPWLLAATRCSDPASLTRSSPAAVSEAAIPTP
ncbi:hypothetical protein [Microbispora sp. ATCC PTA-5024]|nr:hypothetical protein [Microbispora sp. ATCC PTA-5024]ETK37765.1 hypothetical protein MPTA5024_02195 [Microbispora sp. ATCC PTA-5024]